MGPVAMAAYELRLLLLISLGYFVGYSSSKTCYAKNKHPYKLFASKTGYNQIRGFISTEQLYNSECKPVQFYFISRHGTRYPKAKDIKLMRHLLPSIRDRIVDAAANKKGKLCREDVENLKAWQFNVVESQDNTLAPAGENELKEIGMRFRARLLNFITKSNSQHIDLKSSTTNRTHESAKFFVMGLLGVQSTATTSIVNDDSLLRFYKNCQRWKQTVDDNASAAIEATRFRDGSKMKSLLKAVSKRVGLKSNLTAQDVNLIYEACRFEAAWNEDLTSPWCAAFSNDDLKLLEYSEDMKYYYKHGYGHEINYHQACPPVKDIVDKFSSQMLGNSSDASIVLRFSHSGMMLKLLARMGLFKDDPPLTGENYKIQRNRVWRTSHIDSFSTNLALILLNCQNEYQVDAYFQERQIQLPGCTSMPCSMPEFLQTYQGYADNCDVNCLSMCDDGARMIEVKQQDGVVEKVYILNNNVGSSPPVITVDARGLLTTEFRDESSDECSHRHVNDYNEPPAKRAHVEEPFKEMLMEMQKGIMHRLRMIQNKVIDVSNRCQMLEDKMTFVSNQIQTGITTDISKSLKSGCSFETMAQDMHNSIAMSHAGPLITLNSEDDFPDGSWLGDSSNPSQRVRCNVSSSDLVNLNRTCSTPEKMALTLLDYLFDRETQARSNISGMGKHGKSQLDPLMVYGIRCHLVAKFNVTDADWHRIKQNLDSKCRTAFRRKQKGMPLTVKAFRDKWIPQEPTLRIPSTTYIQMVASPNQNGLVSGDDSELTIDAIDLPNGSETINIPVHLHSQPVSLMMEDVGEPQVIHMPEGDIQFVHATAEQIAHFQQNGLQVLSGSIIESVGNLASDSPISTMDLELRLESIELAMPQLTPHVMQLRQAMNRMRSQRKFTDVVIVCGNKSFPAHRLVLVTSSPFFDDLLKQEDGSPTTIEMEDVDEDVMDMVLELMYLGKADVPFAASSMILKTLTTVHLLDIKGGTSYLCRQWLLKGNLTHFRLFWDWADEFNEECVRDTIIEQVALHFNQLPKGLDYFKLAPERMKAILAHPHLSVGKCQDLLVHVILSWINHDPKIRRCFLDKFISYVDVQSLTDPCRQQLVREKPLLQFYCEMKKALKTGGCEPPEAVVGGRGQLAPIVTEEKKLKQAMRKELRKVDMIPRLDLSNDRINQGKWQSGRPTSPRLTTMVDSKYSGNISQKAPSIYAASYASATVAFQEALQDDLCNVLLVAGRGEMNRFMAHIYLPSRGAWSMGQQIPTAAVQKRCSVYCRGYLYFIGGEEITEDAKLANLYVYNVRTGLLCSGPALRVPRSAAGAVNWRHMIFVAGGLNRFNKPMTHVEAFDTQLHMWRLIQPMRFQRHRAGMTVLKGVIYMIGGYTIHCECYHMEKDSFWTELPNLPECYKDLPMIATHHNEHVIAFRDFRPDRVCVLDKDRGDWKMMRTQGTPPENIEDAFTYHGELYAVDMTGKLHVLDLEVLTWDQSVSCPKTLNKVFHITSINLDEVNALNDNVSREF
uniref:Multiple inositol polyphosphate phosphatase 1 n=1 Tax=Strigamia maritima TaxID=126957 RepID=T1J676_STRMM